MSAEQAAGQFQLFRVEDLSHLTEDHLRTAVETYQTAFARPPYNEYFSEDDAQGALQYLLDKKGDLVVGILDGDIVSLAGGYEKPGRVYYIEELAVNPVVQGKGLGRMTLRGLFGAARQRQGIDEWQIRTSAQNDKAIGLYRSEGFALRGVTEAVPQLRQNGAIALDERVYLSQRVGSGEAMNKRQLKRAAIAYPSGNTTAVVFDQDLGADRKELNSAIMDSWKRDNPEQPEIEQCCFVTPAKSPDAVARVEMFGGEFCGNATRSAAWLVTKGENYEGKIEVSGVDRPLWFRVEDGDVAVQMPVPDSDKLTAEVDEGTLVRLDGITHLVVTAEQLRDAKDPRSVLTELLASNKYGLADEPAVGVTYYNAATSEADFAVWVNAVDTIFDETACGSGTSAIGIAVATALKRPTKVDVVQPSGQTISTEASYSGKLGRVDNSVISGEVKILSDGVYNL